MPLAGVEKFSDLDKKVVFRNSNKYSSYDIPRSKDLYQAHLLINKKQKLKDYS